LGIHLKGQVSGYCRVRHRQVVKWLRVRKRRVYKVRTDYEVVLQSRTVRDFCELPENSIRLQHSVPYKHCQNAVERDVQTVVRGASLMLASQSWLRKDCWHLALHHYVDLRNRNPNSNTGNYSPLQLITGERLDLERDFKFGFGDFVAVCTPAELKSWKFDMRNQIGIYVGSVEDCSGGNLIYWPFDKSTSIRYDVVKLEITDQQFLHFFHRKVIDNINSLPYSYVTSAMESFKEVEYDFTEEVNQREPTRLTESDALHLTSPITAPLFDAPDDMLDSPGLEKTIKRKRSGANVPTTDRNLRSARKETVTGAVQSTKEPDNDPGYLAFFHETFVNKTTVGKALCSSDAEKWIAAMRQEVELLLKHTLEPVSFASLPLNRKIMHSTMQLKLKLLQNGEIDKYKARLCACGNELWGNVAETYSPTIGALAYATVHQIAVIDQMSTCTVDTLWASILPNIIELRSTYTACLTLEEHIIEHMPLT